MTQASPRSGSKPDRTVADFLWAGWAGYQRTGEFHWTKSQLNRLGITRALGDHARRALTDSDLWSLALTDELTGLLNRRGFHFLAYHQLKLSSRHERSFHVFYCDLDSFKRINDRYGHEVGDEALIRTARLLERTFRQSDILARFGGDEFVALALETNEHDKIRIERRLQKNLKEANALESRYQLSLCVGAAGALPGRANSLGDLISRADQNLRVAKIQLGGRRAPAEGWSDVSPMERGGGGNAGLARRHPVRRHSGSERIHDGGG